MTALRWGAATDAGRVRPDNEDSVLADQRVFVVADGMGGHRAGEVASEIAVDLLRARLSAPGASFDDVISAVAEANSDIYRAATENADQLGMGTTVTALIVVKDELAGLDDVDATGRPGGGAGEPGPLPPPTSAAPVAPVAPAGAARPDAGADPDADAGTDPTVPLELAPEDVALATPTAPGAAAPAEPELEPEPPTTFALVNVGDSRTYLLRHGRLRRVTIDHSYVQELVATGHISDDEARTHPRRNIVTRALGIDPSVRVDAWTLPIVRGDRFLLCSDGLVDEVPDGDISTVLTTVDDPQAAADELVALANQQGGRDNISVVVVDVLEGADPPDPTAELDLEPAWGDGATASTWAVDDPEGEATEYEDLAALVAGDVEAAAAADRDTATAAGRDAASAAGRGTATAVDDADDTTGTADDTTATADASRSATPAPPPPPPITAEIPAVDAPGARPRRRRRVLGFVGGLALIAALIVAFVVAAAWARRGYFVAFDDDDAVVIYRGRNDGFLWFDPTADAEVDLSRTQLDPESIALVERESRFESRAEAEEFVARRLQTTTTTSTTTSTTSTTSTTTSTTSTTSTSVAPTTTGAP